MVFARLADAALADTLSPAGQAAEASAQFCWFLPRFGRKGIRDSVRSASNQWRDGSQLRRVSAKTAKCVECVAEYGGVAVCSRGGSRAAGAVATARGCRGRPLSLSRGSELPLLSVHAVTLLLSVLPVSEKYLVGDELVDIENRGLRKSHVVKKAALQPETPEISVV